MKWNFSILREKSTIAGIAGLGVVIAAALGHDIDTALMTEIVLAIISVVAIITRPEGSARGSHHRDSSGGAGVDVGVGKISGSEVSKTEAGTDPGRGGE